MEHKINEIRDLLEARLLASKDAIKWGSSQEEIDRLIQQHEGAAHRLAFFNHVVATPPAGTDIVVAQPAFNTTYIGSNEKNLLSQKFQSDFLKSVFRNEECRPALVEMGILSEHCAEIAATGRIPTNRRQEPLYDVMVDAIHPFYMGGTATPDNLCLIPLHLQDIREHFTDIQKPRSGDLEISDKKSVLTIVPKAVNGTIPQVPVVLGGFRIPVLKAKRVARIEEYLGIESGGWKKSDLFRIKDLEIA